ncbi:MAG TPA: hypothetical protein VGM32_15705 [Rhodopila sp.]|jgi:hypothetical protein
MVLGKYLRPQAGAQSPALWGTRAHLADLFGPGAVSIEAAARRFNLRYRSPAHFLEVMRTCYAQ